MIKKFVLPVLVALFLFSVTLGVQAQSEDKLAIEHDIGQYKYFLPSSYPSQQEPWMKKVGIAMYNWTEQNGDIFGVGFYVIEAGKISEAENFLTKIKQTAPNQDAITKKVYKDKSLYFLNGNSESSHGWLWESEKYIVFGVGPLNPPQSVRKNIQDGSGFNFPEEVLDAYLAKYPVSYFECPKYSYTQVMPPDGYDYIYDHDENGCESGRHLEPIKVGAPIPENTPYTVATPVAVPASGGQGGFSEPTVVSRPIERIGPVNPSTMVETHPSTTIVAQPIPVTGRIIEQPTSVETSPATPAPRIDSISEEEKSSRIIQAGLGLESIKITLQNLKVSLDRVSEYYRSIGNDEKYKVWSDVSKMFDSVLNKMGDLVQYLKSTKDLEGARSKLAELRAYMSTVADKILDAL